MNIKDLTSTHFKNAIALIEKREALQTELAALDSKLASLFDGTASTATAPRRGRPKSAKAESSAPKTRKTRKGKHGSVKELILGELKAAGESGLGVQEIASRLRKSVGHIHAWFGSTGKKISGLKKIGRGTYRYAE